MEETFSDRNAGDYLPNYTASYPNHSISLESRISQLYADSICFAEPCSKQMIPHSLSSHFRTRTAVCSSANNKESLFLLYNPNYTATKTSLRLHHEHTVTQILMSSLKMYYILFPTYNANKNRPTSNRIEHTETFLLLGCLLKA
jgi:hypothetical protein